MRNRLIQLLADNRSTQGRQFAVRPVGPRNLNAAAKSTQDDGEEVEVLLYDAIVDTEAEAEWWGGVPADTFVRAVRAINAKTIHLRINSPGGSVFGARAMEQALREHPANIVVHIDGLAASAASFVAMAGDSIVMGKGAMMMIHNAWTIAIGNAQDMSKAADLLSKIDGTLVQTYADRAGDKASAQQIADWMAAETWLTAQEAIDAGLADELAATSSAAGASAAMQWNLSAYLQQPKQAAAAEPPKPASQEPADLCTPEHRARAAQRTSAVLASALIE